MQLRVSRRAVGVVATLLVLYVVSVFGVWRVGWANARHKTEEMLTYACSDCSVTIELIYDGALAFEADNAISALKVPGPRSVGEMRRLVDACGIDELTVVDRTGRVIATSDPSAVTLDLRKDRLNSEFLALTNAAIPGIHQTFRASMGDGKTRRMYSGFPFADGAFLLCGYNESAAARHFALHEGDMMSTWQFGESGCFIVTDDATRRIRYNVFGRPDFRGKTLEEVGLGFVTSLPDDAETTHSANVLLEGETYERCYVRTFHYLGQRIIALVPHREFFDQVRNTTLMAALVLLVVFGFFVHAFNRSAAAHRAISELRAVEEAKREKDMQMATSIQKHSLPSVFPPFPDMVGVFDIYAEMDTAREVGGDFYDFYFVGPDKVALVIADVSGKGVGAAMFMMRAKATLQGFLRSGEDLATAVGETNDRLCAGNADGMFVTAWVGLYDIPTGELTFVNAGHNPPVLKPADGAVGWIKERSGLPLATMEGLRYRPHVRQLAPGDLLFLYTDGVTEAQNAAGRLFGENRLETSLSDVSGAETGEAVCDRVFKSVGAFVNGAEQADDITVLSFRVKRFKV